MFEWKGVRDYLDCLDRNGPATNVAFLVPQVGSDLRVELIQFRGICDCSLVVRAIREPHQRRFKIRSSC